MSDNIAVRVRRIISANLNSLVDAMERANADGVMREAIREVERALDEVRSEMGKAVAAKAQCARAIERTREKIVEFDARAGFAVGQGRDDLAEAAIARQIDLERQIPVMEATLAEQTANEKELDGYAAALSARLREMESDLAAFADARRMAGLDAPAGTPERAMQNAERRAESAGRTFDRMAGVASGMSANELRSQREAASAIEELDRMKRESDIGSRLAELKARRAG